MAYNLHCFMQCVQPESSPTHCMSISEIFWSILTKAWACSQWLSRTATCHFSAKNLCGIKYNAATKFHRLMCEIFLLMKLSYQLPLPPTRPIQMQPHPFHDMYLLCISHLLRTSSPFLIDGRAARHRVGRVIGEEKSRRLAWKAQATYNRKHATCSASGSQFEQQWCITLENLQ